MSRYYEQRFKGQNLSLRDKFFNLNFGYIFCIILLALIGLIALYSAASGNINPWAIKQGLRFGFSFVIMLVLALVDIKVYLKYSYIAYFLVLLLLIGVEVGGHVGMGAQRWIDLKLFKLQPSELMKIALVLVLAKYFHSCSLQKIESIRGVIAPLIMAVFPAALIILQPDLGTALMILFTTMVVFFVVGVQWWKFALLGGGAIVMAPIAWQFLHDYQKNRVLTFLDPERDPLGTGYHIIQSKIHKTNSHCQKLLNLNKKCAAPPNIIFNLHKVI